MRMPTARAPRWVTAVCLALFLHGGVCSGSGREEIVDHAEGIFSRAKELASEDPDAARELFRRAGEGFELAAEVVGDPGAAHYNAGNAFLLSGDAGEAVFQYRMAQLYHPFDPNFAHNLRSARDQVLDSVVEEPTRSPTEFVVTMVRFVPPWMRAGLFAVGYVGLFGLLLGTLLFGGAPRRRGLMIACGTVAVVAGLSLLAEWWVCQGGRDGVVVAEEIVGRTGDGEIYPWAFGTPLHAGVEFRLLERRGEWLRVRLWSGDEGWLPASGVKVVEVGGG